MMLIKYLEISDFNVEDAYVQSLNGGIQKKFTSLATNATLFRWQFGDTKQNPIIETTENPYYHTFKEQGTYPISHQSCAPCGSTLVCSPGWCTKLITVTKPKEAVLPPILTLGLVVGFIYAGIKEKKCKDHYNKKDCQKSKDNCRWTKGKCASSPKSKRGKNIKTIPAS